MQETLFIRKVAVLGAGVMGAQIAAHCVNAGIETLLFDLPAKHGPKNALIDKAIANLGKLKPAPLGTASSSIYLQAKNYDDNISELKDCDLIIEAIAEKLDWKESLYQKIAPFVNDNAILVSNTSGLSINTLCRVLPESLRHRFCGVHFFNPPRYMPLAELIPAETTSKALLDNLETWLVSRLGKGVVIAKDTPNFIANRIGVFSLLVTLHYAKVMDIGLDEVDAITGVLLGRPKSATCRTMDVVGLDTMGHVVNTMKEQLTNDPWHVLFTLPNWLQALIDEGHLGQKSGQGIFRKKGSAMDVFDMATNSYRPVNAHVSDELKTIMSHCDPKERMSALLNSDNKQAKFLAACYLELFHYCAFHLEDIADNVRDVDLAIRWGFGWQFGPFETWQAAGISLIKNAITVNKTLNTAALPTWLHDNTLFYSEHGAWSAHKKQYVPRSDLAVYQKQLFQDAMPFEPKRSMNILYENAGVSLSYFQDEIAILSFKSKANTIGNDVLDGIQDALQIAEKQCQGLIIYQQDATNFSSGADLRAVASCVAAGQLDEVERMIGRFQQIAMRLKYSSIPVVAALRGRALGGGCELMMHCTATVAAFESYPGLVEIGVGLIPAGGGCKEMAMRAAHLAGDADMTTFIQPYFQQIAMATVSSSAVDARQRGYLKASDAFVMNSNEVLFAAFAKIQSLLALNYSPPLAGRFKVAGRSGHARLQAGLVNWLEGGFMSQHDYYLANQIASVLCGGDVNQNEWVDESWMLTLERDAFMACVANPLTQARIKHLLETGKPLRN